MGLKEIFLGSDWAQKSRSEKVTRISKLVDAGTIVGFYAIATMFPALIPTANAAIQLSVGTFAGAEVYERHKQRKKKK